MIRIGKGIVIALAGFLLVGCDNDGEVLDSNRAKVELRLTDAPAEYEEVNIDLQQIFFIVNEGEDIAMPLSNPGIYELLDLKNGIDVLLGSQNLPVGKLSQIRLVLGNNNTIKVNGHELALQTPSAHQSGLKVKALYNLEAGNIYKIWLDFDAGKSVVERGNGTYLLKPVVRAFTETTNGMIEGKVLPREAKTTVYAIKNVSDTLGVAIPNNDGYFKLSGLEEGTYNVNFDAANRAYRVQQKKGVQVRFDEVTQIGTVNLKKN